MTNIIGISGDCEHTSAVALLENGRLVYAEAEERHSRVKGEGRFPRASLDYALSLLSDPPSLLAVAGQNVGDDFSLRAVETANSLGSEIRWIHHHRAHARCAAYTSGLSEGLVATADGQGNGVTTAIWRLRDNHLDCRWRATVDQGSLGFFFAAVTENLGYQRLQDEGKVCALAAQGRPNRALDSLLRRVVQVTGASSPHLRVDQESIRRWEREKPLMSSTLANKLREYEAPDVALAAQERTEEALIEILSHFIPESGNEALAVAGGLFANVRINRRLSEIVGVDRVLVAPPMGDDGLALGAAVEAAGPRSPIAPPTSMFLGTVASPSHSSVCSFSRHLVSSGTNVRLAAEKLARGDLVARCSGAAEFGPRALGNRSLLFRPDDPSVKQRLNARLGRDPVMPFAPSVRIDDLHQVAAIDPDLFGGLRHMTVAVPVTERFRSECPGVVHTDGTARIHAVAKEESPQLWEILRVFKDKSGLPALLNTSLNRHGEPICRTLDEAISCAIGSGVRHIVTGETTYYSAS